MIIMMMTKMMTITIAMILLSILIPDPEMEVLPFYASIAQASSGLSVTIITIIAIAIIDIAIIAIIVIAVIVIVIMAIITITLSSNPLSHEHHIILPA